MLIINKWTNPHYTKKIFICFHVITRDNIRSSKVYPYCDDIIQHYIKGHKVIKMLNVSKKTDLSFQNNI